MAVIEDTSSRRVIPLHKELEPFVLYAKSREGRVLPEFKYSKGSCTKYFTKWFSTFKKREGLLEFHALRHYVATTLKAAGVPVQYTAALLGHSNGNITYDKYGKGKEPESLVKPMAHL